MYCIEVLFRRTENYSLIFPCCYFHLLSLLLLCNRLIIYQRGNFMRD